MNNFVFVFLQSVLLDTLGWLGLYRAPVFVQTFGLNSDGTPSRDIDLEPLPETTANGILYHVDCSDTLRFLASKKQLKKLLASELYKHVPFLVLGESPYTAETLARELDIDDLIHMEKATLDKRPLNIEIGMAVDFNKTRLDNEWFEMRVRGQ